MRELATVILAAGQGTRMKSTKAKVLHAVAGKPMLFFPLEAARGIGSQKTVLVVGYQAEEVRKAFPEPELTFVAQPEQLGTGHAVMCAREALQGFSGDILVLCGDVPLIRTKTLQQLIRQHEEDANSVTLVTTHLSDPTGYGRICRDGAREIQRIVEERDAAPREREITEINAGIYCFDGAFLFEALDSISRSNAQNEYYLTDTIFISRKQHKKVGSVTVRNFIEVMGVNNRIELAQADAEKRREILERHMLQGVSVIDPRSTYIDFGVVVGRDTVVYPHTFVQGNTTIGEGCTIGAGCRIVDCTIGDQVTIKWSSVLEESVVRDHASVGPFAHLRSGADIGEEAKIGNFVEVKKTTVGKGSKASHLTYLGDTTLGAGVNVGAGTITCNYDGFAKHPTVIEDDVFIGSNTALVAPLQVGKGAIIGAGSTITKNVPADALAVERSKQINHDNMAALFRRTKEKK